jgi:hypothetical protein
MFGRRPIRDAAAPAIFAGLVLFAIASALLGVDVQKGAAGTGGKAIVDLPGCATNTIPNDPSHSGTDDRSSPVVSLGFSIDFLGGSYADVYVNNNGNITFDAVYSAGVPVPLSEIERVILAPFLADVDTRGSGSGVTTYGPASFEDHAAFCVNWIDVGYYAVNTDRLNSFQLLLVDRSDVSAGDFDLIFNYDAIQWDHGDGPVAQYARIGYSNGVSSTFELAGSGEDGYFLDTASTGLIHDGRNSSQPGRYIFEFRDGTALPANTPTPTPTPSWTPTPTSTPDPTPMSTPSIEYGNVNCVGGVNSIDAALVLQFSASLVASLACQSAADVNEDGVVNSIDAALILQFVGGLLDELPV